MLKLIIADDERVIRETISTLIDWKQYDIELVGLCSNGLEAYDMILDESPDIVLTDIKMPGLDGLELIKKVSDTDLATQFIILSGYGEFDYAKKAMKYGVKHYLLKPCNELQIIDSIQDTAKTCYQNIISTYTKANTFQTADNMCHHVLFSIINDAVYQNKPYYETFQTYEPYMDFHFTAYHLYLCLFSGTGLPYRICQNTEGILYQQICCGNGAWNLRNQHTDSLFQGFFRQLSRFYHIPLVHASRRSESLAGSGSLLL